MRKAVAFLMMLPVVTWAQEAATTDLGHFEGWPESLQWGPNKQTLEVISLSDIRPGLSLFSVSDRGFGWSQPFTGEDGIFNAWTELSGWCWASEALWLELVTGRLRGIGEIGAEDQLKIVHEYFSRFAADLEVNQSEQPCNRVTFRPPPQQSDDRAKTIELLEAAIEERGELTQ